MPQKKIDKQRKILPLKEAEYWRICALLDPLLLVMDNFNSLMNKKRALEQELAALEEAPHRVQV